MCVCVCARARARTNKNTSGRHADRFIGLGERESMRDEAIHINAPCLQQLERQRKRPAPAAHQRDLVHDHLCVRVAALVSADKMACSVFLWD